MTAPTPIILDVRPDGHNSLGTLPRLNKTDFDVLRAWYKFDWLTTYGYDVAKPGELYFALGAIELKAGPAIVQPRVFGLNDQPVSGVLLWFSWSTAEQIPQEASPKYKQRAVHGWTDSTGSCGWPYNEQGHVGEDGGPFTAWCNGGDGPLGHVVGSDALDRIGYWDDHITPNPWFFLRRKDGATPPPPGGKMRLVAVSADNKELGYVYLTSGQPPSGVGRFVLNQDGENVAYVLWDG